MKFGFHLFFILATCGGFSAAVDRDGRIDTAANNRIDMRIEPEPASMTSNLGIEDQRNALERCRGLDPEHRGSCELDVFQADRNHRDSYRAAVPTKTIPQSPKIELPSTRPPFGRN